MSDLRERLNKLNNRLADLENNPSELTKDVLLADIRDLYDAVKIGEFSGVEKESVVAATEELEEKPLEPEPVVQNEEPVLTEPVLKQEVEPQPEPVLNEIPQEEPVEEKIVVEDPPVFEEVEEDFVAERRKLIGAIEEADKPNDDKILAGQLGKKPLEDLRTGIPLNEKFGIIRGLFAGNASDFGDAVLKLNNAASVNEMKHYLEIMKQRFGWNVESEPYETFMVYVERKMMTHQMSNANTDQ